MAKNITTQWIIDKMEEWAPAKWAVETDNVGLIVGDRSRPVSRVLTALDLSEDILREAVQGRFDFVVTHHPLISRHTQPINSITADTVLGKKLMTLIGNGIGLFCAHTNLDAAPGGVNDLLFDLLGLVGKEPLLNQVHPNEHPTLGLLGYLTEPMPLSALAEHVGRVLNMKHVRYVGPSDLQVRKVGFCSGKGTALVQAGLEKNCDVFLSGDIDYHLAMDTIENKMAMIDFTHYASEIPIMRVVADYIRAAAQKENFEIFVSETKTYGQVFQTT